MSGLPFLPSPLPDELLGSWLARLRLLNGDLAWQNLRRTAGYASPRRGHVPDIADYSAALDTLLTSLGTTFEQSLLQLTTLPYWLSFDGLSPREGILPGTTAVPLICGSYGKPIRSLQLRGTKRGKTVRTLRYCPACLSADLAAFGEPYWHRFHQLPLVSYCPVHLTALRSTCPRCRRVFSRDMNGHLPALRLTCSCKFPLSEDSARIAPTPLQMRFTEVSLDALANQCATWDRHQMRVFLRSALDGPNAARRLIDALDDGAEVGLGTLIKNPLLFPQWKASVDAIRAPACCALLAALEIDFKAAGRAATRIKPSELMATTAPSPRRMAPSVQLACETLSELMKRSPKRSPSRFGIHYWKVRICAPGWFAQHFPESNCRPLPSITADRAVIRYKLDRLLATVPSGYAWMLVQHASIGQRARVRDRAWLKRQCGATLRGILIDKNEPRTDPHQASADVVDDKNFYPAGVPSLAQAKATLSRRKSKAPLAAPSIGSGLSYWVVRLGDPDWLKKHFPRAHLRVPSLRDDREHLRRQLAGNSDIPRTHSPWVLAVKSSAGQRARIRDPKWLEQRWSHYVLWREKNQPQRREPKQDKTGKLFEKEPMGRATRTSQLSALEAVIDNYDGGYRCTISQLAERARLPDWLTRDLLRTEPALRKKVRLLSVKFQLSAFSQDNIGLQST